MLKFIYDLNIEISDKWCRKYEQKLFYMYVDIVFQILEYFFCDFVQLCNIYIN